MLKRTSKQLSMFSSLEDMFSHEHPLFQLSNKPEFGIRNSSKKL